LSYWDITPEEETNIVCLLQDLVIIPFKPEIKKCAINFRRAAQCKTPDSIIAATAILLDAELVTRDKRMLKTEYPGLRIFPAGQ
jgi:predicted nucleic acid-binding protein